MFPNMLLLNVISFTLSLETLGGVATPLIERNTTIGVKKSQVFTTIQDGQTHIIIHILQGERPMATDNISLCRFILEGIPPASRGVPQIEVVLAVAGDVSDIQVTATDKATGRTRTVKVSLENPIFETPPSGVIGDVLVYIPDDDYSEQFSKFSKPETLPD